MPVRLIACSRDRRPLAKAAAPTTPSRHSNISNIQCNEYKKIDLTLEVLFSSDPNTITVAVLQAIGTTTNSSETYAYTVTHGRSSQSAFYEWRQSRNLAGFGDRRQWSLVSSVIWNRCLYWWLQRRRRAGGSLAFCRSRDSETCKGCAFLKKISQNATDIYIAIQSVCLCAYPSVTFPHIVLKRLNIIIVFSSAYGSAIIDLFPVLNNFAEVEQVPYMGALNTRAVL